jgi:putative DNA methylase
MANIVWASGLQVTAAWYVVTETDSALREGSNVKGTVLLVLRKRSGMHKTTRDDLAWEIQEEVEKQIRDLTGLNQEAKGLYRDENVLRTPTSRWPVTPPHSAFSPATSSSTAAT